MLLLFYLIWPTCLIVNHYKYKTPNKIFKNFLSFAHSIGVVALSYVFIQSNHSNGFIQDTLYYFSRSYFIYDSLQIIISGRVGADKMLVLHHGLSLVSLEGLYIDSEAYSVSYCIIEVSNFFNYIVYHMIKSHYCEFKILCMKLLQIIWVFYFRIYCIGNMLYIYGSTVNYNVIIPCSIIYVLGILWWRKQCKSLYYELKKLKSN